MSTLGGPPAAVLAAFGLVVGAAMAGGILHGQLASSGTQPDDVLPANALAYARVDLDPSAGQKVKALRLIKRFPDLARQLHIKDADQDVRELIVDEATADCDVDYDKDVKPWIGDRMGLAVVNTKPDVVFAVQTDDPDAAQRAVRRLFERCAGGGSAGMAFLDDYVIVAETQAIADGVRAEARKKPLADDDDYAADMDALGEQGVASAWVDAEEIAKTPAVAREIPADVLASIGSASAAVALRAGSSSLELAFAASDLTASKQTSLDLGSLPGTTVAAVGLAVSEEDVRAQHQSIIESFGSMELDEFEAETGFRMPDDLVTLLSGGLTIAVGDRNVDILPTLEGPQDVSRLDVGLLIGSESGGELAQRLVKLIAASTGIRLTATTSDGKALLATHPDAFVGKGELADDDAFKSVMDDDANLDLLFVDIAAVVDAIASSDPPKTVLDALREAASLRALGVSVTQDGKRSTGSIKLSLRD